MTETTPHILVIDDQESARITIEAVLAPCDYRLDFANNGAAGLQRLAERRYDVVLCDIMMPGMDGFAVCAEMAKHPEWRTIPTILVSALGATDDITRGLDMGAVDYVTRPFDPLVLRARIRAALRTRVTYASASTPSLSVDELLSKRRDDIIRSAELTDRETAVLDLILLGRTHQDIAESLGISARTSKFHLHNLVAKLGAESRADLLRIFS